MFYHNFKNIKQVILYNICGASRKHIHITYILLDNEDTVSTLHR